MWKVVRIPAGNTTNVHCILATSMINRVFIVVYVFRRASEPGIDMVNNIHDKVEAEEKLSAVNQAKLLKAYQQVILVLLTRI